MFCLTIHEEDDDDWERLVFKNFEQLSNATETAKNSKSNKFEIHSEEWPSHHLTGEKQPNGHIDWVKKEEYY
ncbi:hypothetical protein KAR91_54035 [Candidatus Pacearchaeota archaeon]|nr:hypothetical protein [Candidatus Pacearchaeota archaeon]